MTYNEAYKKGINILKASDIEAPATDAGALLCAVAKCNRTYLYAHGDSILEDEQLQRYLSFLERRAGRYPLQYLTGVQEFMSLPFEVGPGVLIPRQDTELLVESVLDILKAPKRESKGDKNVVTEKSEKYNSDATSILDIGTGSGCIAISLAYYLSDCRVTAVDKMPDALMIARRNARAIGVEEKVRFIESDLFDEISEERFDVIVSNPPYIRKEELNKLQQEVREFEPVTALDGGMDGLLFYRKIVKQSPVYLKKGGRLVFETGYDQAQDVAALMHDYFTEIKIHKDLSNIDRVVVGLLKQNI